MFDDAKIYTNTFSQSNPLLCKMLLYYSTKFKYDTLHNTHFYSNYVIKQFWCTLRHNGLGTDNVIHGKL